MSGVHSVPLVRAGFDLACECSAQPRIEDGHTVAHKGGSHQNEREWLGSMRYVVRYTNSVLSECQMRIRLIMTDADRTEDASMFCDAQVGQHNLTLICTFKSICNHNSQQ